MSTLVMKFGGNAVGTIGALTQVLSIVLHEHKRWKQLVLVASAFDGVTDLLYEAANLAQVANQRGFRRIAANLRTRHLAVMEQLPLGAQERSVLQADIDRLLFEMLDECQTISSTPSDALSPQVSDRIVGVGERLSARIIAALLRQNDLRGVAIDATDIIVTDEVHGNAAPVMDLTTQKVRENLLPMMDRDIIPVVTGFIGATRSGKPTTLGRGGSDYTSSILSVCISASELWIWSDVDGMMSTDPREVSEAKVISEMSYSEVAELAYFGARILHARMIRPIQEKRIPLRIKNVFKPQQPGTLIRDTHSAPLERIKAVTHIPGIGLTANRSGALADVIKLVDDTLFSTVGTNAEVMISSQSSSRSFLCFIIPPSVGGLEAIDTSRTALLNNISSLHDTVVWQVEIVSVVTAIGESLDKLLGLNARIMSQLDGVRIIGLAQGPSRCSLSIIVNSEDGEEALRRIHELTISND